METFDYKTTYKHLYLPSAKEPSLVDVPPMKFTMVDGKGDPNTSQEFQDAIGALYGVTYTIKMLPKKKIVPPGYVIYSIPPLEGLWWLNNGKPFSFDVPKEEYRRAIRRSIFCGSGKLRKASRCRSCTSVLTATSRRV